MKYVSRARAIAHLNEPENLKKFQAGQGCNVEEYFADYAEEYARDNNQPDALYQCVCADLGIKPVAPDREMIDREL